LKPARPDENTYPPPARNAYALDGRLMDGLLVQEMPAACRDVAANE